MAPSRARRAGDAEMRKQIALVPVVLVAALSLSIALVDRIKERVAQDRLSFGDSSATELVSK